MMTFKELNRWLHVLLIAMPLLISSFINLGLHILNIPTTNTTKIIILLAIKTLLDHLILNKAFILSALVEQKAKELGMTDNMLKDIILEHT